MRKFHYIEVLEGEKTLARFQTNFNRFQEDWTKYQAMYPEFQVNYCQSSEKEKVFNHIRQTA